ncbi:MAG: EAL domain-containing protein [Candidatus Manganitrophus sp.]|nr:EAL domain-containing protein [Candidatus Manganitrophus sp.]WDT82629.1 MAG: EAL domain-containing protein [Candidatus Manganitrophus sp.]
MGKLRHAIEHGEMELYYQPQWSLTKNRVIGVEALSRWLDPQLGWIAPDRFISLTEQTGLIKPFTQWILKTVCNEYEEWKKAGLNLSVSVNLSAKNLQEPRFPDQVAELIQPGRFEPSLLEFEITESMIMVNPAISMQVLGRLNAMGISLVIDDFGTGYSSLSYLKKLPVQKIKIDKSFIVDLGNKGDIVIVHSIINMGHSLGLEVIAEGVEDEFTKDLLEAFGCDVIQGYHIGHPLPSEELIYMLNRGTAPGDLKKRPRKLSPKA